MSRTLTGLVCAALLFMTFTATPASATTVTRQIEEHGAWAIWSWGGDYPSLEPHEWLTVSAYDDAVRPSDRQPYRTQVLTVFYQRGIFDGSSWTGEAMIGYTYVPTTLTIEGYRLVAASGTVEMHRCLDFHCRTVGEFLGTAELSLTMRKAPGPWSGLGDSPPSWGMRWPHWESGCTVDQSTGMHMLMNSTATATWTWDGGTRVFPEAGVEYDWASSRLSMARFAELVVCPGE